MNDEFGFVEMMVHRFVRMFSVGSSKGASEQSTQQEEPSYELTQEDFAIFQDEAKKWLNLFCMSDWEVFFWFEPLEGNRAQCQYSYKDRVANITLSTRAYVKVDEDDIRGSAFHEVCELLMAELRHLTTNYTEIPSEDRKVLLNSAAHAIIHRLEPVRRLVERVREKKQR